MKHKHAELIKAWADGAEIQIKNTRTGEWLDINSNFNWVDEYEYRIKPEEKKLVVRWLWAYKITSGWRTTDFLSEEDAAKCFWLRDYMRLDWSRTEFSE